MKDKKAYQPLSQEELEKLEGGSLVGPYGLHLKLTEWLVGLFK